MLVKPVTPWVLGLLAFNLAMGPAPGALTNEEAELLTSLADGLTARSAAIRTLRGLLVHRMFWHPDELRRLGDATRVRAESMGLGPIEEPRDQEQSMFVVRFVAGDGRHRTEVAPAPGGRPSVWDNPHLSAKLSPGAEVDPMLLGYGSRHDTRVPITYQVWDGEHELRYDISRKRMDVSVQRYWRPAAQQSQLAPRLLLTVSKPAGEKLLEIIARGAAGEWLVTYEGIKPQSELDCQVVRVDYRGASHVGYERYWITQFRTGTALVRVESFASRVDKPDEGILRITEGSKFNEVGEGVWLPSRSVQHRLSFGPGRSGVWASTEISDFIECVVNGEVTENDFMLQVPLGTQVMDNDARTVQYEGRLEPRQLLPYWLEAPPQPDAAYDRIPTLDRDAKAGE